MPIANRSVEPVCVSQVKVPESVDNEFDYIFNATLSNFIKQIACLTIKAKDIFDELNVSLTSIVDRSLSLESKIDNLYCLATSSDCGSIQPLVGQQVNVYKSHLNREDDRFVHIEMPDCIREMLEKAEEPPQLFKFDEYRKDEIESMKFYTDPDFFLREWLKNVRVDKKKRKEKRRRKSTQPKEDLPVFPPPIISSVIQEPVNDECPMDYNFADVAVYEDPRSYLQYEIQGTTVDTTIVNTSQQNFDLMPPPPPPPPLPPPPPMAVQPPIFTNVRSESQPKPIISAVDPIQNLLRDIQKGAVLKPVTAVKEEKRKTMDIRAMIAELRPAWDNNSESEESDED